MGNKALDYTALTVSLIGAVNWGPDWIFQFQSGVLDLRFRHLVQPDHLWRSRNLRPVPAHVFLKERRPVAPNAPA